MEDNWTPTTKSKSKDFLKKQGFYIVLFICLLIVGTAIVLTALPGKEDPAPVTEDNTNKPSTLEVGQSSDETLAGRNNTPLPTVTPGLTPSSSPAPTETPRAASASVKKGIAPVDGAIVWSFAVEQLLYSRTLDQWTTHAGIDIAADLGTEVKTVLAGTVEEVYEDDHLGWTVTVLHTNNRKSIYANLDPMIGVTIGQKLNAGDVIGKIGNSATAECGEVSHLHFGFLVDNVAVNPTDYVAIAQ